MPQRDEGMPDSPTLEGPRPPEGHRGGLGSFRRDGRGGGRGAGEGGRWRRVPGHPRHQERDPARREGLRDARPARRERAGKGTSLPRMRAGRPPLTITCEPPGAVAFFFLAGPVPGLAGRFLPRDAAPAGEEAAAGTRLAMRPRSAPGPGALPLPGSRGRAAAAHAQWRRRGSATPARVWSGRPRASGNCPALVRLVGSSSAASSLPCGVVGPFLGTRLRWQPRSRDSPCVWEVAQCVEVWGFAPQRVSGTGKALSVSHLQHRGLCSSWAGAQLKAVGAAEHGLQFGTWGPVPAPCQRCSSVCSVQTLPCAGGQALS